MDDFQKLLRRLLLAMTNGMFNVALFNAEDCNPYKYFPVS